MISRRNFLRQQDTAEAHPAHEGPEQCAQGNGGGADGQLQQLEPDNLVNQSGAAAAGKQDQQDGQVRARGTLVLLHVNGL